MHLAFCSDSEAFSKDQLRNKNWSSRFPGAGWLTCLYLMQQQSGIEVASGDVALVNIAANKWHAKDVFVIQEMNSVQGKLLLDCGAVPFLILCFEAPLYAPFFYDDIDRIAGRFKFAMGFGFSEIKTESGGGLAVQKFGFPSYFLADLQEIKPLGNRRKLVLVAANKFLTKQLYIASQPSLIGIARQLKSAYWQLISKSYRNSLSTSLHDRRLEAIEYFSSKSELDLFGSNWNSLEALPSSWADRLIAIIGERYFGLCQNKLETISEYRFSICYENMVLPGYMTEKIVDCFVAGTVPLYWGAPDIESYVPENTFIDMRKFCSYDEVDEYLNTMDEQTINGMIGAGREYLKTEDGMLHSYEGFADNVIRLLEKC